MTNHVGGQGHGAIMGDSKLRCLDEYANGGLEVAFELSQAYPEGSAQFSVRVTVTAGSSRFN